MFHLLIIQEYVFLTYIIRKYIELEQVHISYIY